MREKIESQGNDLLVIDTGDRVEGNGLYDSSNPPGVYLSDILRNQHIDVITSGNHELYKKSTSESEFLNTVPNFKGNYLASNIDIVHPETGDLVPLALRYKKFTTTKQGIRIVAFGFLFNFNGNYNNTVVKRVQETIQEDWFQEAIREKDVDLFLVAGHVPAHSPEYKAIFEEIRSKRWDTPIQFFAGHQHIRDYAKYDSKAYALASGRFMETVGFMSIDGLNSANSNSNGNDNDNGLNAASTPTFHRRYIDNNLYSYHHHTSLNETTFPTTHGQNVSNLISHSRNALNLDKIHGCNPSDLYMSRAPYPHEDSIYTWLEKKVLAATLKDESRADIPAVAILNTGAIRFDIFKGPFTQDSMWIISPFTNQFRFVKDVPVEKVDLVLEVLNKQPQILAQAAQHQGGAEANAEAVEMEFGHLSPPGNWKQNQNQIGLENSQWFDTSASPQIPLGNDNDKGDADTDDKVIPGYTTKDDAGDDGDDTIHSAIPFYRVPNCIQAVLNTTTTGAADATADAETVDLVYIEFIEPYLTMAAKFAQLDVDFAKDSEPYMPGKTLTDLILEWVGDNWKC